jgi:hypothetical protein
MFKRNWLGIGRIRSDEGFSVWLGNRTVFYTDECGTFQIGYEDGQIFPDSLRLTHPIRPVSEPDRPLIVERIRSALAWEGHNPKIFKPQK